MDSVTQIALGASVGEAVLGRQAGRRAMMWGGLCGLLPDLDFLVPFGNAVKSFTYHRGPSHSLFVLALLTPICVRLILHLHPHMRPHRIKWYVLVYLAFATHVLLDCFTVYGTQILWPLSTPPVMWSTLFIIDPVYSLPLFLSVLAVLVMSRKGTRGHVINAVCLALTTFYILWSVGAKLYVTDLARESLKRQNMGADNLLTTPTPFNTLLWRILVMNDRSYSEGFYSLLDGTGHISFHHYPSHRELIEPIGEHWHVKRLKWFTHGFYAVRQQSDDIIMTDLRMGFEPYYVFQFKVGEKSHSPADTITPQRIVNERGWNRLPWVWQRIWSSDPK